MTTENANPRHPAKTSPAALHHNAPTSAEGLNAENSRPATARGEIFLLTFPFIELQGGDVRSGPQTIWISPRSLTSKVSQRGISGLPE